MITSNNVWYYSFEMVKLSAGGVCAITMHFQAFMKALSVLWVIWQVFIMGLFKEYFPKKLERNLHFSRVYLMPRWRLLRSDGNTMKVKDGLLLKSLGLSTHHTRLGEAKDSRLLTDASGHYHMCLWLKSNTVTPVLHTYSLTH